MKNIDCLFSGHFLTKNEKKFPKKNAFSEDKKIGFKEFFFCFVRNHNK